MFPTSSRLLLTAAVVILFGAISVRAQEAPMKFGDVTATTLQEPAPADTNAAAVVLCDYGNVSFSDELKLVYERHLRVQLLKPSAYEHWATVVIGFNPKDGRVSDIKGATYTLSSAGEVVTHKLDKKSIFEEKVSDTYRRYRFTLPALEPGAVIEYTFRRQSDSPFDMPDWYFQTDEPVKWSEFRAELPPYFGYTIVSNRTAFADQSSGTVNRSYRIPLGEGQFLSSRGTGNTARWVMTDQPALRDEPFLTTPRDFRARLRFQLAQYRWPEQNPVDVLRTWPDVAKELLDSDRFGSQLDRHRVLREAAQAAIVGKTTDEDKALAIYDHVRTTMTFNDDMEIFPSRNLDKAYAARSGSNAEIALILTSMLRTAGLHADPVLISTRGHGRVLREYPLVDQFNDVVTSVKLGDKDVLLDATDPLRPMGMLPFSALNEWGWLVAPEPRWVAISQREVNSHELKLTGKLSADGTVTGRVVDTDVLYNALNARSTLKDPEDKRREQLTKRTFGDLPGTEIDSISYRNADALSQPLSTVVTFTTPNVAQSAGEFIYLNPMLVDRMESSPLTRPERAFPIDMGHPSLDTYALELALPAGYTVKDLPKPVVLRLPDGSAEYRRTITAEGGMVKVEARTLFRKAIYPPTDYNDLRRFYDGIVKAHGEQLVLQRISSTTPAAAPTSGGK